MKSTPRSPAFAGSLHFGLLALIACGDNLEPGNAPVLWLALDGVETRIRLVEGRPPPY